MLLAQFHPYIAPEVIGCPEALMNQALLMIAHEFCRTTQSWTEEQSPVPLVDGVRDYELETPAGSILGSVRDVWVGSQRLEPMTLSELQTVMPDWQTAKSNLPSYYNLAFDRASVSLYAMPTDPNGATMIVRASFIPSTSATTLPDYLVQRYMDAISSGTKARLMAMSGAPWSNPTLSSYYRSVFMDNTTMARTEEAHDRAPGVIKVKPRSFGF